MPNPFIRTLITGSLLGAACAGPTPTPVDPDDGNPGNPPAPELRTWEQATDQSGKTMRTNPPRPVLVTTGSGSCFVSWEGGMTAPGPDRVDPSCIDGHCGEEILCPEPRTTELVNAWNVSHRTQNPPAQE